MILPIEILEKIVDNLILNRNLYTFSLINKTFSILLRKYFKIINRKLKPYWKKIISNWNNKKIYVSNIEFIENLEKLLDYNLICKRNLNEEKNKSPINKRIQLILKNIIEDFDICNLSSAKLSFYDRHNDSWEGLVIASFDTPYSGILFKILIEFKNFAKPPNIKFISNIYHPNIIENCINLNIFYDDWTPLYRCKILHLLNIINSVIDSPCVDSFIKNPIVDEYLNDKEEYLQKVIKSIQL